MLPQCTSTYPASPENRHKRTITHFCDLFGCEVGLSDHSMGMGAAVAFGATVIEKHFCLSRAEGRVDAACLLEPFELARLVSKNERTFQAIGEIRYGQTEAEEKARLRR